MEVNKELKIVPPEGMEYYIEDDTVKFRPKIITYQDVAKELFKNGAYYAGVRNGVNSGYDKSPNLEEKGLYSISRKQLDKLVAINQIMNVAKYLNKDWKPDWNNKQENKYYIQKDNNTIVVSYVRYNCFDSVYFKSKELVEQAIEILGEETIKLALCTDW